METLTATQLGHALTELANDANSKREAMWHKVAEQGKAHSFTAESLGKDGVGRIYIGEALASHHAITPDQVSKGELSKFCTLAHPSVRDRVPGIVKAATTLATESGRVRENVMYSIMSELKKPEVSKIETAVENVTAAYAQKDAAKVDPKSEQGLRDSLMRKANSAACKVVFTEASLSLLTKAIESLEAKPCEEPAQDTGDIADILENMSVDQTKSVLAALMAKLDS